MKLNLFHHSSGRNESTSLMKYSIQGGCGDTLAQTADSATIETDSLQNHIINQ